MDYINYSQISSIILRQELLISILSLFQSLGNFIPSGNFIPLGNFIPSGNSIPLGNHYSYLQVI